MKPFHGSAQRGDRLVRFSAAEGILHTGVLVSGRRESAAALAGRGIPVENAGPGDYVEVRETSPHGGPARSVGRRLTDSSGRMPPGQMIVASGAPAAENSPSLLPIPLDLQPLLRVDPSTVFSTPGGSRVLPRFFDYAKKKITEFAPPVTGLRARVVRWLSGRSHVAVLKTVEANPLLAPFVLGALAFNALVQGRLPWLEFIGRDLSTEPGPEMPAPGTPHPTTRKPVKYLIVSDLHRDVPTDKTADGPIHHFSKNSKLYLRVLDYAIGTNEDPHTCILIENGDAEEFWAIPDLAQPPAERLHDIVKANQQIYDKLLGLCKANRYFRTQGNHDSPLRDLRIDGQWKPLFDAKHEFLIIPGVKTMDEFTLFELVRGRHLRDFLGLDPDVYKNKKCLIVCHGHQFDFWNCEKNELFGKIVSAGTRKPDGWMDKVLPLGGVHLRGNPLFEFEHFFSHDLNLVFNHWLERETSIRKAHEVQHLRNQDRVLRDGFMYQETLASLLVSLLMPLSKCSDGGGGHLGHQLLIGHTHYPQSQPFYPLGKVLSPLIKGLSATIAEAARKAQLTLPDVGGLLESLLNGAFKSRFFNSGLGGWHEGVIYAIEITPAGQARLLYWTDRHAEPEEMDWELSPLNAKQKAVRKAAEKEINDLLNRYEEALKDVLKEAARALEYELGVFRHGIQGMLDFIAGKFSFRSVLQTGTQLRMVGPAAADHLQLALGEFVARMARCIYSQAELPQLEIQLPWTGDHERRLNAAAADLVESNVLEGRPWAAPHAAMVWMYAQEFAPYYGSFSPERARAGQPRISDFDRSLRALGATLCWLPIEKRLGPPGQELPFLLKTIVRSEQAILKVNLHLLRRDAPKVAAPAIPLA